MAQLIYNLYDDLISAALAPGADQDARLSISSELLVSQIRVGADHRPLRLDGRTGSEVRGAGTGLSINPTWVQGTISTGHTGSGFKSWLCHLRVVWPWAKVLLSEPLFPPLQNGTTVSACSGYKKIKIYELTGMKPFTLAKRRHAANGGSYKVPLVRGPYNSRRGP